MRRKRIWLALLASAMVAGSASAATISSGAFWGLNWGSYNSTNENAEFLHNSVSLSNTAYRFRSGVGDQDPGDNIAPNGDRIDPGDGGQNYDAEGVFYYYDSTSNYLHLGIMTGFNPYGERGDSASSYYRAGDLFIGLGTTGAYHIAVGTALGATGAEFESSTRAGSAWYNPNQLTGEWTVGGPPNHVVSDGLQQVTHTSNPNYTIANPYRVVTSDTENVALLSTVDFAHTRLWENMSSGTTKPAIAGQFNYNEERWFYEFRLHLNPNGQLGGLLENLTSETGGIGLHWTMGCGNDYIHFVDSTPFASVVPVPAAAPLGLVGMIAIGLFRKVRSKKS